MAERFLNVILCLSWLGGCFPAQTPFRKSNNFKFTWIHPMTIISVLFLIIPAALMLDFSVNNLVNYSEASLGSGLSSLIAEVSCALYIIIGDAASRVIAMVTCQRLIDLINTLGSLELERRNSNYRFCKYMHNSYMALIFANVINCTQEVLRVYDLVGLWGPIQPTIKMSLLPPNDWIIRLAFWFHNFLINVSMVFAISITVLLGTHLISLYIGFTSELKACWGQYQIENRDWMGDVDTFLEKFVTKFKKLKKAFESYEKIAGPLIFFIILCAVLAFIPAVYSLSTVQVLRNLPGTIGCMFWVGFLAYFGNFMESKIKEIREDLKNTVMVIPRRSHYK
ncbi:unnamed protein product, partial [Allacma fusca]